MADRPTAAQMLAAQAPPPSVAGQSRALGVPDDYQPPGTAPRYYESDVYAPASLAPERIAQLQQQMVAAGLIPKTAKYRGGVWDDISITGYKALLETANVYGVDEREALRIYSQSKPAGNLRDPLAPPVANPADIQATVRTAARALYGHKADDALVRRIVAGFQAEQERASATVADAPNMSTYVNQQLETANPTAVAADRGLEVGNTILQAFMNPAGSLDTGGAS